MISCIKFINVIVHSTEDRNQRVALQYEFTVLGLHEFLEVKKKKFSFFNYKLFFF